MGMAGKGALQTDVEFLDDAHKTRIDRRLRAFPDAALSLLDYF